MVVKALALAGIYRSACVPHWGYGAYRQLPRREYCWYSASYFVLVGADTLKARRINRISRRSFSSTEARRIDDVMLASPKA